jgi:dethiobiotin synthetase
MIAPMIESGPHGALFITGTGTGVGKTIVTAALAALARAAGRRVAVVKLAQTGVHDGHGSDIPDLETVTRLTGVTDTHELARFPDPLSPEAAARVSGVPPVDFDRAAALIAALMATRDLVLVEGAGGLLVRYDAEGATIADLVVELSGQGLDASALVVTAAGLGTLNHTALTLEAAAARKVTVAGVVVGSWPRDPGLAERENLADLETLAREPLAGLLPEGSGSLPAARFLAVARDGLAPSLGGQRAQYG